ncbi:right-handed parallel beta-helix repeat-containing protein [Xylanimonas ulmi]|uniref:right-handed parallel beta-helix repeat-containing protein n=1 Tax=Xylanimonas ulmi TaxID=228973 RepID=UPI00102B1CF8|nr:right-handed parallel beta-helix repeat-containing protein [Xylanibacterium ulmi]
MSEVTAVGAGATSPLVLAVTPHESLADAADRLAATLVRHPQRDVEVRLAPGTYRVSEPVRLGPEHSGDERREVRWAGTGAVISGGVALTWRADRDGRWRATAPPGVEPADLFVGGRRSRRARSAPQSAEVCHAVDAGITGARALGIGRWARPEAVTCVVTVRWRAYHLPVAGVDGDVVRLREPCWTNARGGTGRVGPYWDTTAVDGSQFAGGVVWENAIELLTEPGDHVWDPVTRTVTYLPLPGEEPSDVEAIVPTCESLLALDGVRRLRLTGLTLSHAAFGQSATAQGYVGAQAGLTLTGATGPRDAAGRHYTKPAAALAVRRSHHVVVEDCVVTQVAGAGVVLEHGTCDTRLVASRFEDLGSGAVYIGDTEPHPGADRVSERNTVTRCVLRRVGARYTDAVALWAGYVADLTVDHNTIEDVPYSGISLGWGWNQPGARASALRDNRVTANRIVEVMRPSTGMHDGGAIYVQGAQPGTVIARNHIDRSGYGGTQRDGNGIYLDEQTSHVRVERNVVTRVGYKWLSNWAVYGVENLSRGNWTDTDAPALGGRGSGSRGDQVRLDVLPPAALAIAAAAGAEPGARVWAGRVDLARGRPATQSSAVVVAVRTSEDLSQCGGVEAQTTAAGHGAGAGHAEVAVDGDTCADTVTVDEPDSWWRVDLGAQRRLGAVGLWNAASMPTRDVVIEVADGAGRITARARVEGLVRRPSIVEVDAEGRYVTVRRPGGGVGLSSVTVHPPSRGAECEARPGPPRGRAEP